MKRNIVKWVGAEWQGFIAIYLGAIPRLNSSDEKSLFVKQFKISKLRKGQKDQKEVLVDPYLEQSCVPE